MRKTNIHSFFFFFFNFQNISRFPVASERTADPARNTGESDRWYLLHKLACRRANTVLIHNRSNAGGVGLTYPFTFLTGIYTSPEKKEPVFNLKINRFERVAIQTLERLWSARDQTGGGVLEVRQSEVVGGFPGSGADLCPLSYLYTAAVICLTATHMHTTVKTCAVHKHKHRYTVSISPCCGYLGL